MGETKSSGGDKPRRSLVVAFLAGFALLVVELAAVRVLTQVVGGSLYTWTGVIGVTLAGSMLGNAAGGRLDRLPHCLLAAAVAVLAAVVGFFVLTTADPFAALPLPARVLAWAGSLFLLPAFFLGTVSPQCVRLGRLDPVAAAGSLGAVVGTLATGYLLISTLGMARTLLVAAGATAVAAGVAGGSRTLVGLVGGFALLGLLVLTPDATHIDRESNYFAIRVMPTADRPGVLALQLDRLIHSRVDPADPTFLHYRHEQVQLAVLKTLRPDANVLVIGGGGYTFPRAARTVVPGCRVEVVEIDPAVTAVSYERLGLDPALGIVSHHLDGRRFLAERATARYDLVTLDAVNDLTVPGHLLTRECNDLAKRALTPDGVYLVSVIDAPPTGRLAASAATTLRQTFRHVVSVTADPEWPPGRQAVFVLAASDRPVTAAGRVVELGDGVVLTDQFAPVDQMLGRVYRVRKE